MKKTWTRILSLACVAALVLAFSSCKNDDNPTGGTEASSDVTVSQEATDNSTPAASDASTTAPVSGASTTAPVSGASTTKGSAPAAKASIADIVKAYNAAAKNSGNVKKSSKLNVSNLKLGNSNQKTLVSIINTFAKSSEGTTTGAPGVPGGLLASDVSSATMTESGGKTRIVMNIKGQTDGPKSTWDHGPCGRAMGVIGDVQTVLDGLNAKFVDGGSCKLQYTNAKIDVTISGGKIVSGTYSQVVNVSATNVKALGIISLKSAQGTVNFKYILG